MREFAAEAVLRVVREEEGFRGNVVEAQREGWATLKSLVDADRKVALDVAARRSCRLEVERIGRLLWELVEVGEREARAVHEVDEVDVRRRLKRDEEVCFKAAMASFEAAQRDLIDAAASYNAEYRERMMAKVQPDVNLPPPRPFIGFSLAEDVRRGILVVDGLYRDGPAYQTGIRIGDILLRICGVDVNTIAEARRVVDSRCRCGRVAPFSLVTPMNQQYSVALWIMTADPQHSAKPFFFDVHLHERMESPRKKNVVEACIPLQSPVLTPSSTPRTALPYATPLRYQSELQPSSVSAFSSVTPNRTTLKEPHSSKRMLS
ncbi:putative viscerotropic leishmaniasis antigen [Leptomonas seymouri]|uniref:Putative viscerotropic leishmaniasis antigen n=1 Tax=Leptomonas seymouri TaxID=5684 RepID=A0A0N1I2U7_LEPSE|nr:putative viscerotropic leishmaniasis antigen [Leptomonas seymouri]|eukprot:KPI84143.1 putative viscerotropic leishmaniasis antigen [Leptomonas seymouri]